jgi:predicted secreted protein
MIKKCPSCGNFFTCDGESDCWCENFQIHKKEFFIISEKYTDCICQECLKQYAE